MAYQGVTQKMRLWSSFIPLAGVTDAQFPLLGDFREQTSGQVGDYNTDWSLVNQHVYILVNSITAGGDIVVTGTSVSESTAVPVTGDTETITVDTSTGQYYQTLKKFLEVTSINVSGGSISGINYDVGTIGYYDGFNTEFRITGYRADLRASGNNPDLRLRIRKVSNDGGKKWSFETIEDIGFDSTGSNGSIVDNVRTGGNDRSHTFATELLDNNNQLVFKQSDFDSFFSSFENFIDGDNNEGIYVDFLGQGDNNLSNVDSCTFTITFTM